MFNDRMLLLIKDKVLSLSVKHLCNVRNNNARHHNHVNNVCLEAINNEKKNKKARFRELWSAVYKITGRVS